MRFYCTIRCCIFVLVLTGNNWNKSLLQHVVQAVLICSKVPLKDSIQYVNYVWTNMNWSIYRLCRKEFASFEQEMTLICRFTHIVFSVWMRQFVSKIGSLIFYQGASFMHYGTKPSGMPVVADLIDSHLKTSEYRRTPSKRAYLKSWESLILILQQQIFSTSTCKNGRKFEPMSLLCCWLLDKCWKTSTYYYPK